jgi:hypothetical protein
VAQVTSSMTWQHGRTTVGSTAVYVANRWPNQMTTRVKFWLVEKGATWPSHGQPRGTPSLVVWLYVMSADLLSGWPVVRSHAV